MKIRSFVKTLITLIVRENITYIDSKKKEKKLHLISFLCVTLQIGSVWFLKNAIYRLDFSFAI